MPATFGQWLGRIFGGATAAGFLGPMALVPGPHMLLLASAKRRCDLQFPFNKRKRQECKAAVDARRSARAAGLPLDAHKAQKFAAMKAAGAAGKWLSAEDVAPGVYASPMGPITSIPDGSISVADETTATVPDEERAPAPAGIMRMVSGVPWWVWLGAAGLGIYLLTRRSGPTYIGPMTGG